MRRRRRRRRRGEGEEEEDDEDGTVENRGSLTEVWEIWIR